MRSLLLIAILGLFSERGSAKEQSAKELEDEAFCKVQRPASLSSESITVILYFEIGCKDDCKAMAAKKSHGIGNNYTCTFRKDAKS